MDEWVGRFKPQIKNDGVKLAYFYCVFKTSDFVNKKQKIKTKVLNMCVVV